MKHLLMTLAALLLASNVEAANWLGMDKKVEGAVVKVQVGNADTITHRCSGFVINKKTSVVVTANHCLPALIDGGETAITVDGKDASVAARNAILDLAILKVRGKFTTELKITNLKTVPIFTPIMASGFGIANETPLYSTGLVSGIMHGSIDRGLDGRLSLDMVLVKGQSGGPIVDEKGEVVSIVQFSWGHGYGSAPGSIRDFVEDYLPVEESVQ